MADFRYYAGMDSSAFLAHYGVGHEKGGNSGRYKWGSGDRPYQRTSMEGKNYGDSSVAKEIQKRHKKEAKGYQKSLRKLEYKRTVKKNYGKDAEAAEISKKIKETISELESRGYVLNSKNFQQYVDHGEQTIGYLLAGPFGALAASAIYSNKHKEDSKKYTVRTPEQAKLDAAKAKEKKLTDEYIDAADKFERASKDDPKWEQRRREVEAKEKAANNAMVERARVQHPDDSDEKIATRLGFPVDEVKSVSKSEKYGSSKNGSSAKKESSGNDVRSKAQKALNTKEGKRLADKMDSLEEKYLNIAEDDSTPHDDTYQRKKDQARRAYENAEKQWIRYRDSM